MISFRGKGNRGARGRPQCTYCKRMGRTQENCYSLHGFPGKTTNISKAESSETKFSEEEYQEYLKLKSSNLAQSSTTPSLSTACISQSTESHNPWIIDSGASDHISGNISLFSPLSFPKTSHFITLANGSKVASQGIGQVSLSPSLDLKFVLFVPECPFSLISLSQLTKSLNCSVTFDANSFVIQERGTGQMIGEGHESRGLYYLGSSPSISCVASSPKLLHDRLGHPHLTKLKKMVPELNSLQTLECESCQLGKYVRSSFPKHSESRCDSVFSIIHSDIWGPSCVSSSGFRYFVTFIDEFSRCTWIYLMKDRSELLQIFKSFLNEIRNQFGKIIKIFRSDNAKEYFSSELSKL